MVVANKRQDSENIASLLCQNQTQKSPSSAFLQLESKCSDTASTPTLVGKTEINHRSYLNTFITVFRVYLYRP